MADIRCVLDASALLALFHGERGHEVVEDYITAGGAAVSAVNYSEVAAKLEELGRDIPELDRQFALLDIRLVPFDHEAALAAALLRRTTKPLGLSLADRACLALAARHAVSALTADRQWQNMPSPHQVIVIR